MYAARGYAPGVIGLYEVRVHSLLNISRTVQLCYSSYVYLYIWWKESPTLNLLHTYVYRQKTTHTSATMGFSQRWKYKRCTRNMNKRIMEQVQISVQKSSFGIPSHEYSPMHIIFLFLKCVCSFYSQLKQVICI